MDCVRLLVAVPTDHLSMTILRQLLLGHGSRIKGPSREDPERRIAGSEGASCAHGGPARHLRRTRNLYPRCPASAHRQRYGQRGVRVERPDRGRRRGQWLPHAERRRRDADADGPRRDLRACFGPSAAHRSSNSGPRHIHLNAREKGGGGSAGPREQVASGPTARR